MTASDADDSKRNLLAVTTISTAATTTTTKSKIKVSSAKPYLCKTCGNGFKSYSNLLIHSRIHTGSQSDQSRYFSKPFTFTHLFSSSTHLPVYLSIYLSIYLSTILSFSFFQSRTRDSTPCRVGRQVGTLQTLLDFERFLHYGPCPTVRDCLAVYPALFLFI